MTTEGIDTGKLTAIAREAAQRIQDARVEIHRLQDLEKAQDSIINLAMAKIETYIALTGGTNQR